MCDQLVFRLGQLLAQLEDVVPVSVFVVDGVHELVDEEDAETSDGTFFDGECEVGRVLLGGVEGGAGVADGEDEVGVGGGGLEQDVAYGAFWVGVVHHVDYGFFEGEVQIHGVGGVVAQLFSQYFNEFGQEGHFIDVVVEFEFFYHILELLDRCHIIIYTFFPVHYSFS